MLVAFIVEDGTIVAGANSYVSVAFADAYIPANPGAMVKWAALATDVKEARLQSATKWLDTYVRWFGTQTTRYHRSQVNYISGYATPPVTLPTEQPLQWPRAQVIDTNGCYISELTIPIEVQNATVEVALFYLNDIANANSPIDTQGVKSWKAGDVEIIYQDDYMGASAQPFDALFLLIGLGEPIKGLGFKKIRRV
jgi:hypothetical protein